MLPSQNFRHNKMQGLTGGMAVNNDAQQTVRVEEKAARLSRTSFTGEFESIDNRSIIDRFDSIGELEESVTVSSPRQTTYLLVGTRVLTVDRQ